MILYHVSFMPAGPLHPRVPEHRLPCEDSVTPRICCSTSVEGCIMAKPDGLDYLLMCREIGLPCVLYVYNFDVEEWEWDKTIVTPHTLEQKYGVLDAVWNQEHWLLEDRPYEKTVCKVVDFDCFYGELKRVWTSHILSSSDFFLVNVCRRCSEKTGSYTTPEQLVQIKTEVCDILLKKLKKEP